MVDIKTFHCLDPSLVEIEDEENMITILRSRSDQMDENDIMVFHHHRLPI